MSNKSFRDWSIQSDIKILDKFMEDYEFSMARSELKTAQDAISRLLKKLNGEGDLEAWVQSKITKAADYIDTVADYLDSGESETTRTTKEEWSEKYKRSIDCNHPKGFSQRAHCQGKKKKVHEENKPVSFEVGAKKLSGAQQKLHAMTPKQRGELPQQMVKKLIGGTDLPPMDLNRRDKKESVDICDADGNTFATVIDLISGSEDKFKGYTEPVSEHCGCEDTAVEELEMGLKKLKDTSYDSIDHLMRGIMKEHGLTAKQLHNAFVDKHDRTPDTWIKELREETASGDSSLHDWFTKSKSSDGKPGWVQLGGKYAGKPCAKQEGQTTKPKCGSSKMAAEMSPEEENAAARRKRREDPNPDRKGKAKMVATHEAAGEKDACYKKVKRRFKVWPSAYASGALVQCRKKGAANWGTKSEEATPETNKFVEMRFCPLCNKNEKRHECSYGPRVWDQYSVKNLDQVITDRRSQFLGMREDYQKIQSSGRSYTILFSWRGRSMQTMQMFFPSPKNPTKNDIAMQLEKVYPGARVLSYYPSIADPTKPIIMIQTKE